MKTFFGRFIGGERLGALLFLALAVLVIVLGMGYGLGDIAHWGSGAFPAAAGLCLAVLSLIVLISSRPAPSPSQPDDAEAQSAQKHPPLRAVIGIVLGVFAFTVMIEGAGLIPAIFVTSMCCALGFKSVRIYQALVVSISLCVVFWLLFIVLLGLPIPLVAGFYG